MRRIHPRDPARFPFAEKLIEAWLDAWRGRIDTWGEFGFVDYFAGPHLDYRGKYARPYRYGPYTYTLRPDLWLVYARSGARRAREFAARTNRAYADNVFAHWDAGGKIRGLYVRAAGGDTERGDNKFSLPFYWGDGPALTVSSSSDLNNLVWDYYLTGYRRARDQVLEFAQGIERYWTPERARGAWRPLMLMRLLAQAYAFTWNPKLRAMAEATTDAFTDPECDIGLTKDRPYHSTTYKTQVDIAALLDGWELLGSPRCRELSLKVAQYWWGNLLGKWPLFYTNPQGRIGSFLYRETGDPAYAEGLRIQLRQAATIIARHAASLTGGHGEVSAEKCTFVFQGIPYAEQVISAAGAGRLQVPLGSGATTLGPRPRSLPGSATRSRWTSI